MSTAVYYRTEHAELIHLRGHTSPYPPHSHVSVYTVGVVLEGTLELRQGNEKRVVKSGEFFVISPYEVHSILPCGEVDMISVCIRRDLVSGKEGLSPEAAADVAFPLLQAADPGENARQLILRGMDCLFLCCRSSSFPSSLPSPCCEYVAEIRSLLERRPDDAPGTGLLAREAAVCKDQLIRRFKKEVGLTPRKFQLQNRVRMAQRLIEKGRPITEVAQATGFYDQSHFDRQFRHMLGMSPVKYRKSVRVVDAEPQRSAQGGHELCEEEKAVASGTHAMLGRRRED